jgi:anti-sigma-K factor RskA
MSGVEENTPEVTRDDPMIAAEWALGLLEGEELLAARGKYATDPDFAWRK